VDVRDVAEIHIWAFENPETADGERYIANSGCGYNQAVADILREVYPDRKNIPVGESGKGYKGYGQGYVDYPDDAVKISGKKAEQVIGIKWIPLEKTIRDTAKALEPLL
jgi:nucleoside-diphosphate-sugar epimerase